MTIFSIFLLFPLILYINAVKYDLKYAALCEPRPKEEKGRSKFGFIKNIFKGKIDCGEDAFFVRQPSKVEKTFAMGVADGVGGYRPTGVASKAFAWDLMEQCKNIGGIEDPLEILKKAHKNIVEQAQAAKDPKNGGSTAVVLTFNTAKGILRGVNYGDSGYMILRRQNNGNYKVIFTSETQIQRFRTPFQLDRIGKKELFIKTNPKLGAATVEHQLQENDIILVSSDSLFQNLYSKEIARIINNAITEQNSIMLKLGLKKSREQIIRKIGAQLLSETMAAMKDLKRKTPYSHYFETPASGGKKDDTTILSFIVKMVKE